MTLISTSKNTSRGKNIFERGNLVTDRQGCIYMVISDSGENFDSVVLHTNTGMLNTGEIRTTDKSIVTQYVGDVTITAE